MKGYSRRKESIELLPTRAIEVPRKVCIQIWMNKKNVETSSTSYRKRYNTLKKTRSVCRSKKAAVQCDGKHNRRLEKAFLKNKNISKKYQWATVRENTRFLWINHVKLPLKARRGTRKLQACVVKARHIYIYNFIVSVCKQKSVCSPVTQKPSVLWQI